MSLEKDPLFPRRHRGEARWQDPGSRPNATARAVNLCTFAVYTRSSLFALFLVPTWLADQTHYSRQRVSPPPGLLVGRQQGPQAGTQCNEWINCCQADRGIDKVASFGQPEDQSVVVFPLLRTVWVALANPPSVPGDLNASHIDLGNILWTNNR